MKNVFRSLWVSGLLCACGAGMGGIGQDSLASAVEVAACPELNGGAASASFDADARANTTIRAFVQAAGDLARVAARAEAEVSTACRKMGADLGLSEAQMAPRGEESRVSAACNAVSARIDEILAQGAHASLKAKASAPKCTVETDVAAACKAQCAVEIDPGYVKANCEPGQLYGRCEGTCGGSCSGSCNGKCDGKCAGSTDADGTCHGECSGQCQGACQGECKGSCSVEFQEPKCAVEMKPPKADARCAASCKAHANLRAECTPAKVSIKADADVGELPKLVATLEENLPVLVSALAQYGERISGDVQVLVNTGAELPNAFGQLTAHAGSCIAAAANATLRAQASIRVSIQASASVSAKAGVRGGT